MADLFLSYAREDRECAESLARALKNRGWAVWWDRRIQVGRSFSAEIERELDAAACVLVLWSRNSVASEWVQNEAAEAARRKVLVPVRIEDVRPPLEFRRLQTADLFDWRNGLEGPEFEACIASIEALAQRDVKTPVAAPEVAPQPQPDYWIQQDGKQFHAPDIATLVQWAKEGRVKPEGQVYDAARKQFTPARDVAELRDAFHKTSELPPNEFWVNRDGKQFTVPDLAALRKLAEDGGIDGETSVYDPGLRTWVFARTMRTLDGALPVKAPPPDVFWVHRDDQQFAVPDIAVLRKLAEEGGIDSETSVYDPGLRTWVFARTIHALDGALSVKTPPPSPATAPAPAPTPATPVSTPKPKHKSAMPSREFKIALTMLVGVALLMIVIASMSQRHQEPVTDTAATDTTMMQLLTTDTVTTANIDTIVTDTTVTQAATTISISLTNTCKDKTISAAIAYIDTTGTWVSHGWYILAPGETRNDLARATDPNVYYYGVSGESVWQGTPGDTLKHPIPVNKTAAFGGPFEQLTGAGIEKVSFFGRTVPAGQTTWTQIFSCD